MSTKNNVVAHAGFQIKRKIVTNFFIDRYFTIDNLKNQVLNMFWLGFLLYTACFAISSVGTVNYNIVQTLQIVGILLFIPSAIYLISFKFDNLYIKAVWSLYFLWLLFIVIKGLQFNYDSLKFALFDAWFGIFLYFVPVFLLFPRNLFYYRKLFDAIVVLGLIYALYDFLYLPQLREPLENTNSRLIVEIFSKTLATPCLFLILTYKYHSFRKKFFAISIVLLTIIFALIRARRGLLLMELIPLGLVYLLYLSGKGSKLFVVVLSIFLLCFLVIFGMDFFSTGQGTLFHSISERGLEDTRTGVELCFYHDMGLKDWIFGRGMNGQYFCPGIEVDNVTGYRYTIETDYLQTILKGGLVSLSLFLLIAVPAVIQGLFYSKNMLSKAAAMWILWGLISMYPASVNTFTMQYILVWVSIGICYSKTIRNIPEEVLTAYFQKPREFMKTHKTLDH